jgi:DNA-binding transcriptional MerR regulator
MSDKRFEIAPPDRDGRRCVCEWLEITREGERHVFEYFREYTPAPEAASADEQFVAADAGVSVESVREAFAEPAATPSDAVTRDKERKEQIAEVETEIDLLCKVWPAYYPSDSATMERIVDVEKARLAELKRGLREVPRG